MRNLALMVAGLIFLAVSLLHFVRYFKGWQIILDNFTVPMDWSIYGGIVALLLAIWMFWSSREK